MSFNKFPSIEQLHTITREALKYSKAGDYKYLAKIKLHGTNACVQVHPNGDVKAQKRTGMITPENDNFGFAQFVQDNADYFRNVFKGSGHIVYVHGEWAGIGIQKEDAVSQCPKTFYVFMLEFSNGATIIESTVENFLSSHPQVKWVPSFRYYDNVNFFDQSKMDKFVEQVENDIESIAMCDPYIRHVHGVHGPGEGLVFYPVPFDRTMMFKVKTEAHMVNKRVDKKVIAYSPEKVSEIQTFADKYCTEARYKQALTELNISDTFSIKDTGKFIGWVCKDVHKECQAELEVSNLEWKNVATKVTNNARLWFLKQVT